MVWASQRMNTQKLRAKRDDDMQETEITREGRQEEAPPPGMMTHQSRGREGGRRVGSCRLALDSARTRWKA